MGAKALNISFVYVLFLSGFSFSMIGCTDSAFRVAQPGQALKSTSLLRGGNDATKNDDSESSAEGNVIANGADSPSSSSTSGSSSGTGSGSSSGSSSSSSSGSSSGSSTGSSGGSTGGSAGGSGTATSSTTSTVVPTENVHVDTICSADASTAIGGTIMTSPSVDAKVFDGSGNLVCTVSGTEIRSSLINEHKLALREIQAKCPALTSGSYVVKLVYGASKNMLTSEVPANSQVESYRGLLQFALPPTTSPQVLYSYLNFFLGIPVDLKIDVSTNGTSKSLTLGPGSSGAVLMNTNPGYQTSISALCDLAASPLMVQLHVGDNQPRPFDLTAPLSGIRFDILGERARPRAHSKNLISWFTPESAQGNYFIVLPDSQGRVLGIDQMFGDNTRGTDGNFAANGYEALRKWDGRKSDGSFDTARRDGVISGADDVFSRLRLWSDTNADGNADASELHTLASLGVVSIDLNYDPGYLDRDRYGNEIRMKSLVRTSDGLDHVMYDLWFRVID